MYGETSAHDSMQQKNISVRAKSVQVRYRYLFILATVCGGAFFMFSVNHGTEIIFLTKSPTWGPQQHARIHDEHQGFTIKTEGCSIPELDPFDDKIQKFVVPPENIKPCLNANTPLLDNNQSHIWVLSEHLKHYHTPDDFNLTCCYRPFYRPSSIADIFSVTVDDRVQYLPCIYFNNYIEVLNEFVRVSCGYAYTVVYEQYFIFAPRKPLVSYRDDPDEKVQNQSSYNVIVMGLDAMSRLNFYRTMPKTLSFLKKKGAIELLGYNKVGDNTFPNLTPMLLGIREEDLKKTCWPTIRSSFDNCPFVWEWYKQAGFYTALGEDSGSLGTFNWEKYGFIGTPTDYYIRTFINEAEIRVGNNKDFNSHICLGNKFSYQVLLDYIEDLTSTLKSSKLFGFFWEVTMSHDYLNYPMIMDNSYEKFLKNLEVSKYLDNTILILLSDHGIRWGGIRYTKQGRLEERLPLVHILLPQSFRENYTVAHDNLRTNSRRLTTPFDIHATLSDLVDLEAVSDDKINLRSQADYASDRSISLFMPIPRNRTCKSAGIADHWCTCHKGKKLSKEGGEAREAGVHLIRHLNLLLKRHTECARLQLAEVIDVTELLAGVPDKKEIGWREYMVVVRATPGDGVFEATLRRDALQWSLVGSASRLNLYGEQSRCVHHYKLKLYCYCQ